MKLLQNTTIKINYYCLKINYINTLFFIDCDFSFLVKPILKYLLYNKQMHFFHYDISKYLKDGIQKSIHGNVAKQVALNRI